MCRTFRLIPFFLVMVVSAGCAVGPDYQRPQVNTPDKWRFEYQDAKDFTNTAWWRQFNDPVLDELVTAALKENADILIAAARVEQYLGYYGGTRSALFPQIGAGAIGARERYSQAGRTPLPAGVSAVDNTFQGLISAGWEMDIWGRLRRETEAARADLLASEEARNAVVLTVVAAVANTYIDLRSLDRELEITRQTAVTRGETYALFKERFDSGIISELELSQVRSEYEKALATIPRIEKSILQTENALGILLGRNPAPITRGRDIDTLTIPAVPAGIPSDLLERRPDIRLAEAQLIAANARIGAAKAQYFPSIALTGFAGAVSADFGDLFTGPAGVWNYGAQATVPIFTAGRIVGSVQASEAVQQQALARYRQAIQNSFREVDDALIDQRKSLEEFQAQSRQVDALKDYARLARMRFDEGYTSYIEVLDADRSLFNEQLNYTQIQAGLLRSLVSLYKAMGGGWVVEAASAQDSNRNGAPQEAAYFP
ncbi:MAG: efflux transporter outer membrane subunit [Thermodesulfobacteriota bacterium]